MGNGIGPQGWMALALTLVGVLLLGYMVTVEGEPGLLPLVLTVAGVAWFLVARRARRPRS
jgi:hypothetical protein